MKKLQKLDEFKKFAILKKGIGIESQNVCKQFKDQTSLYSNIQKPGTANIIPELDYTLYDHH